MDNMTLKTALKETYGILLEINVPISMIQQIGVPVMRAMENLSHIMEAIPDQKPDEHALTEEDI